MSTDTWTNAELAELTGLRNLDEIALDPEALECRALMVRRMMRHLHPDAPLRVKAAFDEYRDRCDALLEAPGDDLCPDADQHTEFGCTTCGYQPL